LYLDLLILYQMTKGPKKFNFFLEKIKICTKTDPKPV
jgi:DNA-binding HxlR family transcriptional regulator